MADDAKVELGCAALRAADWDALMPGFLRYARWRLRGLRGDRDQRSRDLVTEAVTRIMDGRRLWHRSDAIDVAGFVKGVMRSVGNEWLNERIDDAEVPADENHPHPAPALDDVPNPDPRLAEIEAAVDGDAELEDFYLCALDGHTKREDVASALGWHPDKVSAIRKKLRRRLEVRAAARRTS